jgi:hypothetical protein
MIAADARADNGERGILNQAKVDRPALEPKHQEA